VADETGMRRLSSTRPDGCRACSYSKPRVDVSSYLQSTRRGAAPSTIPYDRAGRPTSSSEGITYAHDPAGNLTRIAGPSTTWDYGYDPFDRMTSAARQEGDPPTPTQAWWTWGPAVRPDLGRFTTPTSCGENLRSPTRQPLPVRDSLLLGLVDPMGLDAFRAGGCALTSCSAPT
jgi:YD repeat-containing protein